MGFLNEVVIRLSGSPKRDDDPSEQLLRYVEEITEPNPLNHRARVYGQSVIEVERAIDNGSQRILLNSIRSFERGKGQGSAALKMLCDAADRFGVSIQLIASSFGDGLSNDDLIEWYGRYGFEALYPDEPLTRAMIDGGYFDMLRVPR